MYVCVLSTVSISTFSAIFLQGRKNRLERRNPRLTIYSFVNTTCNDTSIYKQALAVTV